MLYEVITLVALKTDLTVSVTGIAGPGGGTPQKKVGLVYFGVAQKNGETEIHEHYFPFPRASFREYAAFTGIYLLYNLLKEKNETLNRGRIRRFIYDIILLYIRKSL